MCLLPKKKLTHVAQHMEFPPPSENSSAPEGTEFDPDLHGDGKCGTIPPWLVIHYQIPSYAPSMWGVHDGPGWSLVMYHKLNPYGRKLLKEQKTNSSKLIKRFWDSDPLDKTIKGRLK